MYVRSDRCYKQKTNQERREVRRQRWHKGFKNIFKEEIVKGGLNIETTKDNESETQLLRRRQEFGLKTPNKNSEFPLKGGRTKGQDLEVGAKGIKRAVWVFMAYVLWVPGTKQMCKKAGLMV